MRILIADDELVSRKLMERIMTGYGECVAVNGRNKHQPLKRPGGWGSDAESYAPFF